MPKFSFSIFNDKDPTKTLNVAYMSAFGIIFVLTVITHIITSQITDKQASSTELVLTTMLRSLITLVRKERRLVKFQFMRRNI